MSGSPKVLSDNLVLYTSSFFENTAKVLPPTAALPNGKVVVQLGQPRSTAGLVSRDLLDGSSNFATTAPAAKVPYPIDTTSQVLGTDNQLIRLQDGSLLASKNGYVWSDLSPKPPWFDTTNITVGGVTTGRARNAVFVFHSTNGGASWTLHSYIDSAVVEGGKYGWPQPGDAGTFGVGGFDRSEIYQDPWTGDVFISGHGDGGPYTLNGQTTSNHAGVIFRSQDNGKTWKTFHVFADQPNQTKGAAPYEMTSTPDHPLIVFHIENSAPTMYFVEGGAMSAALPVVAKDGTSALNLGFAADEDDIRGSQPCIARLGKQGSSDRVWIAYPTLNASGHQLYVVAEVTFGGSAAPAVELVAKVAAEQPSQASAIMGAFVYDDLADPDDGNQTPTSLFYWIDAPPKTDPSATNKLTARFQVFYPGGSFPPGTLSVSGGAKRTFSRVGIGDYFSGGYFWLNHQLNFLCQWNETDGIKANVVSMPPIPRRFDFNDVAIDPLALILTNQAYVRLTLPDPPPPGVLRDQIAAQVKAMSVAQRKAALANLERVQAYVKAVAGELDASTHGGGGGHGD